jgi:hypothetical protein
VRSCRVCGGHSSTGVRFLRVLRILLPIIPLTAQTTSSQSGAGTVWTQSHLMKNYGASRCSCNHCLLLPDILSPPESTDCIRKGGAEDMNGVQHVAMTHPSINPSPHFPPAPTSLGGGRSVHTRADCRDNVQLECKAKNTVYHFLLFATGYSGFDRLCGLVIRVLDYRSRGTGFDSRALP